MKLMNKIKLIHNATDYGRLFFIAVFIIAILWLILTFTHVILVESSPNVHNTNAEIMHYLKIERDKDMGILDLQKIHNAGWELLSVRGVGPKMEYIFKRR